MRLAKAIDKRALWTRSAQHHAAPLDRAYPNIDAVRLHESRRVGRRPDL
jgi:hypothetical protein